MRRRWILALFLAALVLMPSIAEARVVDEGGMFSQQAITQMNQKIDDIAKATGKDVLIVTVPSLGGRNVQDVAKQYDPGARFDGLYIFVAKQERALHLFPAGAAKSVLTRDQLKSVYDTIVAGFKTSGYDSGMLAGLDQVAQAMPRGGTATAPVSSGRRDSSGGGVNWLFIIMIGLGIFFLIKLFGSMGRGQQAQQGYPPQGQPGYGPQGQPGYGQPGYGAAPGGGGFMSGLLGGVGGAIAGNYLYDKFAGGGSGGGGHDLGGHAGGADAGGGVDYGSGVGGSWGDSGGAESGGDFGGGDFGGGGGDW